MTLWTKAVGIINKRKHTSVNEITCFKKEKTMTQARVLDKKELKDLLQFIATRKHAARDRAMVLMTHLAGMRVKEVACTKIKDVLTSEGTIKSEIHLSAKQTKGKHSRVIVLSEKLQKELLVYLQTRFETKQLDTGAVTKEMNKALFNTQKRSYFNANTLCNHFYMLYKAARFNGASSHSGRRSFLTALSSKGVALKTMMELAGHRQIATTTLYIDVSEDIKRAAVELL